MPVTDPRGRLVNVRVSSDEFASIERAMKECGARSISDYIRVKVLQPRDRPMEEIHERLKGLDQRIEIVLKQLEKMTEK
jgi:hypothetical protein